MAAVGRPDLQNDPRWTKIEDTKAEKAPELVKILDEAFAEEEYAIAIAKDNTELLDKVNAALGELKEPGKLDEIIGKYISAE